MTGRLGRTAGFPAFSRKCTAMERPPELETGTTTVGLACKDGVVLAAGRRATAGTMIAHKRTKKVYRIDDTLGLTTAGLVGDLQVLARYITAEAELYRLKRSVSMSVEAAATLTANILAGRRYFPYWVQLVLGGVDGRGNHVFSLDMAGGGPGGGSGFTRAGRAGRGAGRGGH